MRNLMRNLVPFQLFVTKLRANRFQRIGIHEISRSSFSLVRTALVLIAALCAALPLGGLPLAAQDQPKGSQPKPAPAPTMEKPGMAAPDPKTEKPAKAPAPKTANPDSGKTVEEIIARVNNEIITRSEYDKARQTAGEDAKSECQNRCTAEQLQIAIEDRQKHPLRGLLDQSLLVQRAKDMGVSV